MNMYVYRCVQKKEPSAFYEEFSIWKKRRKKMFHEMASRNYQINVAQNYLLFAWISAIIIALNSFKWS